ncbi:MAG: oligopeptide/dipeptide ABC transporter ATP-binding protein, partial [Deinococcota bacterium]
MTALLEVRGLKKYFPITQGLFKRTVGHVKAVDDVSFTVNSGETLGLVGESGCGKTTTGHCILRGLEPTAGNVIFNDDSLGSVDIVSANKPTLKTIRQHVQMIFQDPNAALNPRMTVLDLVGEPLLVNGLAKGANLEAHVRDSLERVGLPSTYLRRFPHAFSGGQRQRLVIARALALNPQLIVADEPTSALDVSIQAQTLNLLQELQAEFNLTYVFIAHDLSVIEHISDRVAVMYVGRIVELADTKTLYHKPKHPYTEALLSSVPRPLTGPKRERIILQGDVPNPASPPSGCHFHPRCNYAKDICKQQPPPLVEVGNGHLSRCHFAAELSLQGVNPMT